MSIRSLDPARALGQLVNKMEKVNQKPCRNMSERFSKKTVQLSLNVFAVALGVSTVAKDIILLVGVVLITPVKLEILIVRFIFPGSLQGIQEKLEHIPSPVDQIAHILVDILGVAASTTGVALCLFKGSQWNVAMQKGLFAIPSIPQIAVKAKNGPKPQALKPAAAPPTIAPVYVVPQPHAAAVQPSKISVPALIAIQPTINKVAQAAVVPSRIPDPAIQPTINALAQPTAVQPARQTPASVAPQSTIVVQAAAVQPPRPASASVAPQPTTAQAAQPPKPAPASVAPQPTIVVQTAQPSKPAAASVISQPSAVQPAKIPPPVPLVPPPPFKSVPAPLTAPAIPPAVDGPAAKPPPPPPRFAIPAKPVAKMQPLVPLAPAASIAPPAPPPRTYSQQGALANDVVPVPPPPPPILNGSDGQFPARSQALLQAIRESGGVRKQAYESPTKFRIKRTPQSTRSKALAQRRRALQGSPDSSPEQENSTPAAANIRGYPVISPARTSPRPAGKKFSAAKHLKFDEPSTEATASKPPRKFTAADLNQRKAKLSKEVEDGATPRKRTQKKHQSGSLSRYFGNLGPAKAQTPPEPSTPPSTP